MASMQVAVTVSNDGEVNVSRGRDMSPDQTLMVLHAGIELIRRKTIALEVDAQQQARGAH